MRKAPTILALVVIALGSIAPVERVRAESEQELMHRQWLDEEYRKRVDGLVESEESQEIRAFIAEVAVEFVGRTLRAAQEKKALEAEIAAENAEEAEDAAEAASGAAANK